LIGLFKDGVDYGTTLYVTGSPTDGDTNWHQKRDILWSSAPGERIRGLQMEQGAVVMAPPPTPPADGRIVMTGTVTAGAPATASVIGPRGDTLSGVVVDVDGSQYSTDAKGRIVFPVAAGTTALVAVLAGNRGSAVSARVVAPALASSDPVAVTSAPPVVSTGQTFTIGGTGFSSDAAGNNVQMGGSSLNVLASSTSQLVVSAPGQAPLGPQELTVTTDRGTSVPRAVDLAAIQLISKNTALHTGQAGDAQLVVTGTSHPVTLNVTNLTSTISLVGGDTLQLRTSGGAHNHAKIAFRGVTPGDFRITAVVASSKE
jgi:hypothetical protein